VHLHKRLEISLGDPFPESLELPRHSDKTGMFLTHLYRSSLLAHAGNKENCN
jgi:hypothetical protein